MKGKFAKEKTKTNSIFKKIVLMAIIVTMLAGDFILPVKLWSIAKEYEKIENSISADANETSSTDGNVDDEAENTDEENAKTEGSSNNGENTEDDFGKKAEENQNAEKSVDEKHRRD